MSGGVNRSPEEAGQRPTPQMAAGSRQIRSFIEGQGRAGRVPNSFNIDRICKQVLSNSQAKNKNGVAPSVGIANIARQGQHRVSAKRSTEMTAEPVNKIQQNKASGESGDWEEVAGAKKKRPRLSARSTTNTMNRFDVLEDHNDMDIQDIEGDGPAAVTECSDAPVSQNARKRRSKKPPPINSHEVPITTLMEALKKFSDNDFDCKSSKDRNHTIRAADIGKHKEIVDTLKTSNIGHFSYTPEELQSIVYVMKGMDVDYSAEEVKEALSKLKIENVNILKVDRMFSRKPTPDPKKRIPTRNIIVQLSSNSEIRNLIAERKVLNQIVSWEPIKKSSLFQCFQCQRVGHASKNCGMPPRCVKCAGPHSSKECEIKERGKSDDRIKCANCHENHPASYRGCKYLRIAEQIIHNKQAASSNLANSKVTKTFNKVNKNISFANVVNNTGRQSTAYHVPPLMSNFNTNFMENFKHEIVGTIREQFTALNTKIDRNTSAIKAILNHIKLDYEF